MKNKDLEKIWITTEQLDDRCKEIAQMIDEKHPNKPIVLVGLLKGAYAFMADILKHIKNPKVEVEFLVASSYLNGASLGFVQILLDIKKPIAYKTVIIIEDIVDTGRTLSYIKDMFNLKGAKKVEIAAMCSKPSGRTCVVDVDYPTFEIPNRFMVGYGLDYNEHYRHLPYVASLTDEAIEKYKKY